MALSQAAPYSVAQANLELLRQRLREALFAKKARLRELAELCQAQRAELRGWIKQRREQALADLRNELRQARSEAAANRRTRLQDARRSATSSVDLARAAVEIERAHAAEHLRITRAHDTKRVAIDKAHARSLSDDLMSAATLKRLRPLLEKAGKVRPAPGESRTEALWRYARAHPDEMHALLEPKTERIIAQTQKEIAAAEEALRSGGRVPLPRTLLQPVKPGKSARPPQAKKPPTRPAKLRATPRPATLRLEAPLTTTPPDKPAHPGKQPGRPATPPSGAAREKAPRPPIEESPEPIAEAVASPLPAPPSAVAPSPSPPATPIPARPPRRVARPRPQLGLDFDKPATPVVPPPAPEQTPGVNPYEQKKAARIEKQRGRAAKLRAEADDAQTKARAIGDMIPMGQPILVGHHSEGRHRRDIGKIDKAMRKSVELTREADTLERRASRAEKSTAVSSDDPEAIPKLRSKLADLDKDRERMRAANAAIRSGGDIAGRLKALGFSDKAAEEIQKPDPMGRVGFPAYAFQNASTERARIAARIADLEKRAAAPPRSAETIGGATLSEQDNRVRVFFPCVPPEAVRTALKGSGFRWSPTAGAWQRMSSGAAWSEAKRILLVYAHPPAASLPGS
jgi:hypothetical protein